MMDQDIKLSPSGSAHKPKLAEKLLGHAYFILSLIRELFLVLLFIRISNFLFLNFYYIIYREALHCIRTCLFQLIKLIELSSVMECFIVMLVP